MNSKFHSTRNIRNIYQNRNSLYIFPPLANAIFAGTAPLIQTYLTLLGHDLGLYPLPLSGIYIVLVSVMSLLTLTFYSPHCDRLRLDKTEKEGVSANKRKLYEEGNNEEGDDDTDLVLGSRLELHHNI
jgi:hypothetical protein